MKPTLLWHVILAHCCCATKCQHDNEMTNLIYLQVGRKFANMQRIGTPEEVESLDQVNAKGRSCFHGPHAKAVRKRKRDAWQVMQDECSRQGSPEEAEAQRLEVAAATKSLHHQIGQQVCMLWQALACTVHDVCTHSEV